MMFIPTFFLNNQALPFTIALGFMVALCFLEVASLLLGLGVNGWFDSHLPDLPDLPDGASLPNLDIADLSVPVSGADGIAPLELSGDPSLAPASPNQVLTIADSPLMRILGWLHLGTVPTLVLAVLFLTLFGLVGLTIQFVSLRWLGTLLPVLAAVFPALVASFLGVHYLGGALGRVIPKDETSVVSGNSMIGVAATIVLGEGRKGAPAQAKVKDSHGKSHYFLVEPQDPEVVFKPGETVVLLEKRGAIFEAVRDPDVG